MTRPRSRAMWKQFFQRWSGSGQGLQAQIRQMLVSAVLDEQIPLDEPLPSSREMAATLGVARNTVVLAYQHLVDEGFLISSERRGYFVNPLAREGRVAMPQPAALGTGLVPGKSPAWATRFRYLPSGQRNIRKRADWSAYPYPFLYGQFDASLFSVAEWRDCCLRTLSGMETHEWGQDLILRDDDMLVQQIRTRLLPPRGVWAAEDEIMITVGAQHALFLIADLLIGADTPVGVEDPGYPDVRNILAARSSRVLSLPVDAEGLRISRALNACQYVFTTPSHQCPTTVTLSMERRRALLDHAERHDIVLVEDDYESQSSFEGEPFPTLKSMDRSGRVIYVGSLSKTLAPGIRLGYVVAPRELINELRMVRRLNVRHPNTFAQRAFALFLSLGHYDALLRRLAHARKERAYALMAALDKHLPELQYVPITGGSSCWVEGPPWLDVDQLVTDAESLGVLIEPGNIFFRDPAQRRKCFRLGYSSIAAPIIDDGIRLLSEAFHRQKP